MALYKSVYYYYYYYRYKAFRERKPYKGWPFPITASGSDNKRILISSDVRVKTDGDRYTVWHSGGHVTYGYLPVATDVFQVLLGARYGTPVDMRPTVTFPDAACVFQVLLGARR